MIRIRKPKRGSSLIEIVMYFTILGVFLAVAMTFAFQITGITAVSEQLQEFQANTEFISDKISYSIYTSTGIDSIGSVFDNDNGILSLNMSDPSKSPTRFYLTNGNIFIKEGANAEIQLNTNNTTIDKANFHRITYDKSPDQIMIDIRVLPISNDFAQLQRSSTINLSLSLRTL